MLVAVIIIFILIDVFVFYCACRIGGAESRREEEYIRKQTAIHDPDTDRIPKK